eukprot:TRINITY_DN4009_c0_g1_i1.p2 TRINITY_DN4009_c0_g1~~TRINITY_DN4009_c0_g1_i1.p2  ORF type:complete len:96 (+),score=18.44 TRINITY_DN4009_c0_g1_i1:634-921(+)
MPTLEINEHPTPEKDCGNCVDVHVRGGCQHPETMKCVCKYFDECCESIWDGYCARAAVDLCSCLEGVEREEVQENRIIFLVGRALYRQKKLLKLL